MIRSTIAKSFHRFLTTNTPAPAAPPPPSHFSNPKEIPEPFGAGTDTNAVYQQQQQQQATPVPNTKPTQDGSIKEITALIAMFALAYIAIDNYTERIRLEKLHNETSAINLKALQIQQLNHQREKKQKDLTLLQERREIAKRDFKMSLHIAMLRKQLMDLGVSPIELDLAIKEFEKNVKLDNSIKNVTGQYLWLDDSSGMLKILVSTHLPFHNLY